jgi:hypothetical protein
VRRAGFFVDRNRQLYRAVGMIQLNLEHRITEIKRELSELGPLHPGSVSEQCNICGTPGCHCKDEKNPRKHGPYYQLSYGWRGKSSSLFGRPDQVGAMREKVANYRRLQEPVKEWVDLAMEIERWDRSESRCSLQKAPLIDCLCGHPGPQVGLLSVKIVALVGYLLGVLLQEANADFKFCKPSVALGQLLFQNHSDRFPERRSFLPRNQFAHQICNNDKFQRLS